MKNLYLWLNLGSFLIPFIFSFHPKLRFYKKWKSFSIGILVMMALFIPWDIWFTHNHFWGFNNNYITGYTFLKLPIEEWLFFICIPYACIFTHYSLQKLFPKMYLPQHIVSVIHVILILLFTLTLWYHYNKWYTLINFCYAALLLGIVYNYRPNVLSYFFPSYFILFIPFFIVNGILTGTGIKEQVVWYDNTQNLGIRLLTIPIEDTIYNLGMLLTVFFTMNIIDCKKQEL